MSAEQKIRAAFADLSRRAREDLDPREGLARLTRPRSRSLVPALAAAAVVFVLVGGFALLRLLPGEIEEPPPVIDAPIGDTTSPDASSPDTNSPEPSSPETTAPDTSTTDTIPPGEPASLPGQGSWYRVNREMVSADASDPFLNVRAEPDPAATILAKLAPTYAGIRATGEATTSDGGGSWWLVELLDPVTLETSGVDGDPPMGWVNGAFLEQLPSELPVTTEEVPPCRGQGAGNGGADTADPVGILFLRTAELSNDCTRVVVAFGTPPGGDPVLPVPEVAVFQERRSSGPLTVNFPGVTSAWAGSLQAPGAQLVRELDGSLSLLVGAANREVHYTVMTERGLLVVDVVPADPRDEPPAESHVVLTGSPLVGPGSIDVQGIARPFEATLGVQVLDASGTPVEAVFSGSDFLGTVRTTGYGVMTNDWTEAWGRFALRVEGLAPGDYTLVLDGAGGETPERALRHQFTVAEPGEATPPSENSNELATAMVGFARTGDPSGLELADGVRLGLGDELVDTRDGATLADSSGWEVNSPDGFFAERGGPFDALDLLASAPWFTVSEGEIPSCASPPRDWPELEGLRQVNVEPVGIDSCIEWFAVSMFVNTDEEVEAVVLDLGSP